jgi:hypothetical protein
MDFDEDVGEINHEDSQDQICKKAPSYIMLYT